MSDDKQANSDPLPYTQVDRAVKPKSTLLAAMIQSTPQHALGSLVEFWDLNGDPRELERLVLDGKHSVVLGRDEVRRRFRLASGHDVDPDDLRSLGLLEQLGEDFRVRGMSRYFAPVERRLQARAAASAGGKASAASRKATSGTAQPRSAAGSDAVREPLKRTTKRHRSATEAAAEAIAEAPPKPEATQRSAVSGQRSAAGELLPLASQAATDPRHAPLIAELVEVFAENILAPYPFKPRDAKAVAELLAIEPVPERISTVWRTALRSTEYPKVRTLSELVTHFAHFVGGQNTAPRGEYEYTDHTSGPE